MSRSLPIGLLFTALACFTLSAAAPDKLGTPPVVRMFELSGGGKVEHLEAPPALGQKAFLTKANKKTIPACVDGSAGGACSLLTNDPGGKVFLYIFTSQLWGVATSSDPLTANITLLNGLTDGKGKFIFMGLHAATGSQIEIDGKASLDKAFGDDLIPKSVRGKLRMVSNQTGHFSTSSFKTGKPLG